MSGGTLQRKSNRPRIRRAIFPPSRGRHEVPELQPALPLREFVTSRQCYHVMPHSSKLVIFDIELNVTKAFHALVYNGARAAPLWDSKLRSFVGILTITDFVKILHHYYHSESVQLSQLAKHKIQTWREQLSESSSNRFVCVHPTASLYDAICALNHNRIHRLPVVNPVSGNLLCILTHKRILKYIVLSETKLPASKVDLPLKELPLGTRKGIVTVRRDTPIIHALDLFLTHKISALPVVDDTGRCVGLFSRFDTIRLASDESYLDLNKPIQSSLTQSSSVKMCGEEETLREVIVRLVDAQVHRLVIADSQQRVTGVISLSDIFNFLVLKDNPRYYPALPMDLASDRLLPVPEIRHCPDPKLDTS